MLTARRDPLFHPGEHDLAHAAHSGHTAHSPGFNRFMTFLQVAGSVLAIPLGLASGYSIYHANFSAEARCQGLRANIISMLDKSADASTLRMLVRRDVADFESACGTVDPDAVAAFKTLLASGKQATPARAPEPVKQAAHASVRPAKEAAKPAPAKATAAVAEAKHVARDAASADAKWISSVRAALIHVPEAPSERESRETRAPAPALSLAPPTVAQPVTVPQQAAPALPPAASVAAAPAPAPAHHPVPPGLIPDNAPATTASVPATPPEHSGFRGVIAEIPLLGRVVGK
jgi:hypothetical protein